jgi:uncharacterized protein (TIGR02246 family)
MSIEDQHIAINHVRDTLVAAVNRSDAESASQLWTLDGRMMPPNQPTVHGRSAIRAHFAGLFMRRRFQYTLSNSELQVSGDTAVERVEYHVVVASIDGRTTGDDSGKGIHIYQRQTDGRWLLSADIWNSDRGANPPA